tara:strand:- start:271 stop:471 length:201 start_codon:yes stop_codon:yes gene_type:complete
MKKFFKNIIPSDDWEYSKSRTKRNILKLLHIIESIWGLLFLIIVFFTFGATLYFVGKELVKYVISF